MTRAVAAAVFVSLLGLRSASAQVTTAPRRLADPYPIGLAYEDLDLLDDDYNAGNWDAAIWRAKGLLRAAQNTAALPEVQSALDFTHHYVIVTWVGRDAFARPTIGRVIVHGDLPSRTPPPLDRPRGGASRQITAAAANARAIQGRSVAAFEVDLPGVGVRPDEPVIEVFFSRGSGGQLADVFMSTRDRNPIDDQAPAFAQAIASPLFETIGVLASRAAAGPQPPSSSAPGESSLAVTVSRVGLPFARATITWKAVAKEPIGPADFNRAMAAAMVDIKFSDARNSTCAQELVDVDADALAATVKDDAACAGAGGDVQSCKAAIGAALARALASRRCNDTSPAGADRTSIEAVDKKIRAFVDDRLAAVAEAQVTFRNRPRTHVSFGAGSAIITSASLTLPRVKVDKGAGGVLTGDPLPRTVSLAFINWSPAGYDAQMDRVGWSERVRPFLGATITPDFGVAGGANVMVAHGIAVLVGSGVMFAKGAHAEQVGSVPPNPDKPFTIAYAKMKLFLGLGYNFK